MEESKTITLPLGNVTMDKTLGSYYIDMRPANVHYESNIWNGCFDKEGVPMCGSNDGSYMYFPINIAQYCFILHAEWIEKKDTLLLKKIEKCLKVLEDLKTIKGDKCIWYHHHFETKYKISAPWASAMAQGELISLYLRIYQINGDDQLLKTAIMAYNYLKIDYKDGGVRRYDQNGNLWFEEYPSEPPSYVLNGFIYALFGLYDLFRVTNDDAVKNDIDACIETLKINMHKFDAGYWSYYDLLKKELVRYYYQKNVHVPQLEVLYLLTQEPIFNEYKRKWKKTINPLNFVFVQIMYRVLHRWQKLKRLLNNG